MGRLTSGSEIEPPDEIAQIFATGQSILFPVLLNGPDLFKPVKPELRANPNKHENLLSLVEQQHFYALASQK